MITPYIDVNPEFLFSEEVRGLTDQNHRRLLRLMQLSSRSNPPGVLPHLRAVSRFLDCTEVDALITLQELMIAGLFRRRTDGRIVFNRTEHWRVPRPRRQGKKG